MTRLAVAIGQRTVHSDHAAGSVACSDGSRPGVLVGPCWRYRLVAINVLALPPRGA